MNKAVIFIPGIKGTKLHDSNTIDNEILWQDFRFNIEDIRRTELSSFYNGQYYDESFTTITKPLNIEVIAYREFWEELKPENKFIFPYDWRLPNKENGKKLKEFMQLIIDKSNASETHNHPITHFDIITHSMGNMPLRYYILENGMHQINKIIFVTPPFKGSIEAITAFVVGEGWFFTHEKARKLARTLPALFELLPTFDKYAIDSVNSDAVNLWDINNWQKNLVTPDEDENSNRSKRKFAINLQNAKVALQELENWNKNLTAEEKDRIMVLVRTNEETRLDVVIEKNPADINPANYVDLKKSLKGRDGDGVVPDASTCCYCTELVTYCFEDKDAPINFKHALILKDGRVQKMINGFLQSDKNASSYHHDVLGRTVHRVKSLESMDINQDGLIHTIEKINKS